MGSVKGVEKVGRGKVKIGEGEVCEGERGAFRVGGDNVNRYGGSGSG